MASPTRSTSAPQFVRDPRAGRFCRTFSNARAMTGHGGCCQHQFSFVVERAGGGWVARRAGFGISPDACRRHTRRQRTGSTTHALFGVSWLSNCFSGFGDTAVLTSIFVSAWFNALPSLLARPGSVIATGRIPQAGAASALGSTDLLRVGRSATGALPRSSAGGLALLETHRFVRPSALLPRCCGSPPCLLQAISPGGGTQTRARALTRLTLLNRTGLWVIIVCRPRQKMLIVGVTGDLGAVAAAWNLRRCGCSARSGGMPLRSLDQRFERSTGGPPRGSELRPGDFAGNVPAISTSSVLRRRAARY